MLTFVTFHCCFVDACDTHECDESFWSPWMIEISQHNYHSNVILMPINITF